MLRAFWRDKSAATAIEYGLIAAFIAAVIVTGVPGRPGAQPPVDAVQHLAVIHARHTARLVRQKRLDDRPFESPLPALANSPELSGPIRVGC
jgi:hypothetical protein